MNIPKIIVPHCLLCALRGTGFRHRPCRASPSRRFTADAPRETILAIVSFITAQLRALTASLQSVRQAAPGCPQLIADADADALQAEIDKTMTAILETGFIGA